MKKTAETKAQRSACMHLVFATYHYNHAGQIVASLVQEYLAVDGITAPLEHLALGPMIAEFIINMQTVAQALDHLSELTGIPWHVQDDTEIWFGDPKPPYRPTK